jgi:hypothetical protein
LIQDELALPLSVINRHLELLFRRMLPVAVVRDVKGRNPLHPSWVMPTGQSQQIAAGHVTK